MVNAFRAVEVISALQPIGLSHLARELNQPKATVLRALNTLRELGWVEQDDPPSSRWSLTYHAYAVATRTGMRTGIRDLAVEPMSELQSLTSETIHLCVPDGRSMIVIERLDSSHTLRAFLALGTALQMHASGTGLAFLGASDDQFVENYLAGRLDARTEHSLTTPADLRQELESVRSRGYSINVEGRSEGITSLGAAIKGPSGLPIACVSVSGPSSRVVPATFDQYGKALVRIAQKISDRVASLS